MVIADRSAVGPTRYQLLETLRAYARERLDAAATADEYRRHHAVFFAEVAAQIGSGPAGS
jgi:predicted ATPase